MHVYSKLNSIIIIIIQLTMRTIISICLLLPLSFAIYGEKIPRRFAKDVARLDEWAKNKTKINGVLLLKEDGFLGDGGFGFVYEGTNIEDGLEVAIKFATQGRHNDAKREFQMYFYLKAYKNVIVEQFGIPAVYFHGVWGDFIVTAITKLDKSLNDMLPMELHQFSDPLEPHQFSDPLDALILIRQFIIQSKYMHSCGVRHDDIKPENIMVRGHQSFLIDFNLSSKLTRDRGGSTMSFASRRYHKEYYNLSPESYRMPIDDWESFLYTICCCLRIPLKFFLPKNVFEKMFKNLHLQACKEDTIKIRNCIKESVTDIPLKMILLAFAEEVYNDRKQFPDYDRLEELVRGEIANKHDQNSTFPPMFSWLTDEQKLKAKADIEAHPFNITTDIKQPISIDWSEYVFPNVEWDDE